MHFDLFFITDIVGIAAFTISGFLVGIRYKLDLLGLIIVAALTALGGGILRDALLQRTPFAFSEYYPALTLIITLTTIFLFKLYTRKEIEQKWLFVISDTIGLIAFSITGTMLGIAAGYNFFGVIILSFLTAIGGGVLRDTMINRIPRVLTHDFYGSIALIVALMLLGLNAMELMTSESITVVGVMTIGLRLIAYKQHWHLPKL